MDEHTSHRRPFEDKIPEDVRQHTRAAREEMRESMKARTEMLLAWRSMIDASLERMDKKKERI